MASVYPGTLDNFTNPTASDNLDSVTVPHATQHANANDAIENIQAELGTNPKGASATVKARLDGIDTTVSGKATLASANTFTTGTQTVKSGSDTIVPLAVQRNSVTASANIVEFQTSTGTSLASVSASGGATFSGQVNLAAGTTTVAPLDFQPGTSLTSPSNGAVEFDGNNFFFTSNATAGRGILTAPQMVRVDAARTKTTNNTTLEAVFDSANDTLALATNTLYYFKAMYFCTTSASASAGGITVGFTFSNAQASITYRSLGYAQATGTAQTSIFSNAATAITVTPTATAATAYVVELEGWFKSNATTGGTLIPAFAQSVAGSTVAPTMGANSYFMIQPIAATPTTTLIAGAWS